MVYLMEVGVRAMGRARRISINLYERQVVALQNEETRHLSPHHRTRTVSSKGLSILGQLYANDALFRER